MRLKYLLHEGIEGSFHDFSHFELKGLDCTDSWCSFFLLESVDMQFTFIDACDIVVN
jgi:hypothetical protein